MIFPRLVYKCPGPYQRAGGTYDHACVDDERAHAEALAAGWFATLPEAISPPAPVIVPPVVDEVPNDNAPPTRAELEAKATELGVKFDGRTGDAKLGRMIAEALRGLD